MANHKSAKKRIRQNETRKEQNKIQRSIFRGVQKSLRLALSEGKKEEAQTLAKKFQVIASKMVSKGILKKNNASRKTSRMTSQANGL